MKKNDNFFHYRLSTGIDTINLTDILIHINVTNKILPYFKDKPITIISYSYTSTIASNIFNYKRLLQNLEIEDFNAISPKCTCTNSPFKYGPSSQVVTGD